MFTRYAPLALLFLPTMASTQTTHWGMSSSGGDYGIGTIWKITEAGTFTRTHDFFRNEGGNPKCELVKYSGNGKLYGVTELGGVNGDGTIFSYDASTGIYTMVAEFASATTGSHPLRGLTVSGTKLYGTCSQGGASSNGTLYEFNPSTNALVKKVDFGGTGAGAAATGTSPRGRLVLASNNLLYGTTFGGGTASGIPSIGRGTIFSYSPGATAVTKVFSMVQATGQNPSAGLMRPSTGTILYGITFSGGANGFGAVYSFNTTGNAYADVHDLTAAEGKNPVGELVQAGSLYYGTCSTGGASNLGTLFSFNPTGAVYTNLHDMAVANGFEPVGRLMLAANGLLYGQTNRGSTNDDGVIFSFNTTGSVYTNLVDMNTAGLGDGFAGLLEEPAGTLYGLVNGGGAGGTGALYKYVIATNALTEQVGMSVSNGATPKGRLTMATNGKFYGLTTVGGTNDLGVLFSYDPTTSTFTKLVNLSTTTGSGPRGTMALSGSKLYGLCNGNGTNGGGSLFEFDPATNTFTKKLDLSSSTGTAPLAGLMRASNGKLYGSTSTGGSFAMGTLFEYLPATNTLTVLRNMATADGTLCEADFMQAGNGLLYGCASAGGAFTNGTLFSVDPSNGNWAKLHDFDLNAEGGAIPAGELAQHSNGKLYGTCRDGGLGLNGGIYSWVIGTSTYTGEYDLVLAGTDGRVSEAGLHLGADGNLYGTCLQGGANDLGALFKYVPGGAFTVQKSMTLADGQFPANGVVNDVVPTNPAVQLSLKMLLEGPLDGNTGLMNDALRVLGSFPLSQPYTSLGFTHVGGGGSEVTTAPVLAVTGNNAIVDWVFLELRNGSLPGTIVATHAALLQRDGDVVDVDGVSPVSFTLSAGNYWIVARHRNHLACMTLNQIALSGSPAVVNLTDGGVPTYGTQGLKTVNAYLASWAGNTFRDTPLGILKYTGTSNDRDLILSKIGGVVPTNTVNGYFEEDCNLDGVVKYTGSANDRDIILANIGGVVPTNTRTEQLP